jgi:hypothetical protein
LAAGSLLVLPRGVAYDPWSWLVWGREIAHLHLDTREAATSVKPLPMIITTLVAPLGSVAPILWLLIARAATLLALALAFRLGRGLGGPGAGVVAALGLAVSDQFLGYLFVAGMSEPMAVAAFLGAVDSHIRGRHRWALACLVAAGLLRPEAWPFLAAYCLWLARRTTAWRRAAAAVIAVAVPASWFVIDWFGSGHLLRSAGAASQQSQGGPLLSSQPGLATVRESWQLLPLPIVIAFLLGLTVALVFRARDAAPSPALWMGLVAVGWLALDAAMAQARVATGASRYLLPGAALACVVAGGFVSDVVRTLKRLLPSSPGSAVAALLVGYLGIGLLCVPRLVDTGRQINTGVRSDRQLARLASELPRAVSLAGGRATVARCGRVSTNPFQTTLLAWQLRVPIDDVGFAVSVPGTVFEQSGSPSVPAPLGRYYHTTGSVGLSGGAGAGWVVRVARLSCQ